MPPHSKETLKSQQTNAWMNSSVSLLKAVSVNQLKNKCKYVFLYIIITYIYLYLNIADTYLLYMCMYITN